MKTTCAECAKHYDDAECSTICPHQPLFSSPELARQKLDGLNLLGKTVRFAHMLDGPDYTIIACAWDGMVSLKELSGHFAPHIFKVSDDGNG